MFKERRKFPRAIVKYGIKIICHGAVLLGEPADYVFHTYTENMSEVGINVILEKKLKTASLVKLELYISSKESLPLRSNGLVTWTKKVNPKGTKPDLFATGIKFLDLPEFGQEIISTLVQKVLNKT